MKDIEPVNPVVTAETKQQIADFWSRNVNAEEIFGDKVSSYDRGTEPYFSELAEQRYRSHRHLLPWIEEMGSGNTVLEIGCGIGLDSFQMAKQGLQVTGIDLTEIAVTTVRNRFKRHGLQGRFEVGDATQLQFEDNSFDYVYSFGVLHHTTDTEKSVREAHRVLKKRGVARIMLYNRNSVNELIHRLTGVPFEDKDELCPVVRRFTVSEVNAMFGMFSNVKIQKEHAFGEGYGLLFRYIPRSLYRILSRCWGWHLMITAQK